MEGFDFIFKLLDSLFMGCEVILDRGSFSKGFSNDLFLNGVEFVVEVVLGFFESFLLES